MLLGDLVPSGTMLVAPFRTSSGEGAVLIYPRQNDPFTEEEESLVSTVIGFGAVAVANSELFTTAQAQAHELQQLLNISAELGSLANLDQFMRQFVFRASAFLGFERAFVGLQEDGLFRIRWKYSDGKSQPTDAILPAGITSDTLLKKQPFWTDHPSRGGGRGSGIDCEI